jgi:deazaflavin-dependent oxidoreductase (nitroreductase family)
VGGIDPPFCYLTTTGRRTGRPHTIEIWFAASGSTLYLLAGGRDRADWVRNLRAHPSVRVRVGRDGRLRVATARVVEAGTDEDALGRRLILAKYQAPGTRDLESWGRSSLLVALDLAQGPAAGTSRDITT